VILSVLAPVFGLILVGHVVLRAQPEDGPDRLKVLMDLVYWLFLPSLLFTSVLRQSDDASFRPALVYFAVALGVFGLAYAIARVAFRARMGAAAIFALNSAFGNTGLLGIPIVGLVWGPSGLLVLLTVLTFHSASMLPLSAALIEIDRVGTGGLRTLPASIAKALVHNPIIVAIATAFAWHETGWALPLALARFLDLMAQAAPALALICLGISLPRLGRTGGGAGGGAWREAAAASLIKLLLLPAAALDGFRD
jgi:malonate transporter